MESVTVSSNGQIAIPEGIRETLNLAEGAKLNIEMRGEEIVLSKEPSWRKLKGAAGQDLIETFVAIRRNEREREDPRP
mgnify:CR=1 FL=1